MKAQTANGGTVIHTEGATEDATNPTQRYINVVDNGGDFTVEGVTAGPNATHPVIRSHFISEAAAIAEARGIASGMRADDRWFGR